MSDRESTPSAESESCPLAEHCARAMTRRAFAAAASAAVFLAALPEAEARKLAFRISRVKKLTRVGGFVILNIKGRKILFVRDSAESVRALDAICTHKHWLVSYEHKSRHVVCPKHGSRYALDGSIKKGPSEKPLGVYRCRLVKGRVLLDL